MVEMVCRFYYNSCECNIYITIRVLWNIAHILNFAFFADPHESRISIITVNIQIVNCGCCNFKHT